MYVCLCPFACEHISGTARPIVAKFYVLAAYGRGSIVLWRRCDTLCTSGFVDDVMFTHGQE